MRRLIWIMALVALLLAGISPLRAVGEGRAQQNASHLYIMFLPGLCGPIGPDPRCKGHINAASRAKATFATLMAELQKAHVRYTPLYFSYSPTGSTYTVNDTHEQVAQAVTALERQMRATWNRDHGARFDLVGHSLGGVVAASWDVTNGRWYGLNPTLGLDNRLNSIVTFDSPVKGIQQRYVAALATQLFGGEVWYSLQPQSETIKEITFFPDQWWQNRAHLHSVANSADLIVPPPEALLGTKRLVLDSNCSTDLLFLRSCHGAVLQDASLNRFVACHWITDNYQCGGRPTVTPSRTPTRTPRPTATFIPTPTTPIPTETPVVSITPTPVQEVTSTPTETSVPFPFSTATP